MASIEQAVIVLFDPRQPDHLKKSAMELTELAKQDPMFYKFAIQKIVELTIDPKFGINLYFWYFQALEEQIRKNYSGFSLEAKKEIQLFVEMVIESRMDILQVHVGVLNKFAVLYVRIVQEDFPEVWPQAFSSLMIKIKNGPEYVKLFLSVLKTFSEEFTEELGSMTQEQLRKSNSLKDAMRQGVLAQASEIWREILSSQDLSLASATLKVMSAYISWIPLEVSLSFFQYFCEYLKHEPTQVPSLQCIDSLVNKKMDPVKKLSIIKELNLIEFIRNFSFEGLDMLSDVPKTVSVLLDSLGEHLLDCGDTSELIVALECGLKCLNNEDPQISGAVFGMFSKFIRILKNKENLEPPQVVNEGELAFVSKIRAVLMTRATLPAFEHVGPENSDEEDLFYKYRAELVDIFKQTLDLPGAKEAVLEELARYAGAISCNSAPEQIELLYFLLFHFAEKVMNLGALLKTQNSYTQLLEKVINFQIPCKNIVIKMYLENIVRYATLFDHFANLFPKALEYFLTNIENPDTEIRKHSIYMFYRLAIKNPGIIVPYVEPVLQQIIKTLNAPILSSESQKELFKTIGILIGNKKINPSIQITLFNNLCDMIYLNTAAHTVTMFTEILSGFNERVSPELVPKLSQTLAIVMHQACELPSGADKVRTICLLLQKIIDTLEASGSDFIYKGTLYLITQVNLDTIDPFFNIISNCCNKIKNNLEQFLPVAELRLFLMSIVNNVPCPVETITDQAQTSIQARRCLVKLIDVLMTYIPEFFSFDGVDSLPPYIAAMGCNFIESSNSKLALLTLSRMIEKFKTGPMTRVCEQVVQVSWELSEEILVRKKVLQINPDVIAAMSELVNLHRELVKMWIEAGKQIELIGIFSKFLKVIGTEEYCCSILSQDKNMQVNLRKVLISQLEANKNN